MSAYVERLALAVQLPAFPGPDLTPGWARLLEEGVGGICLFGSNTAEGPQRVADLTSAMRAVAPDLVVATDEEGGDVTRLHYAHGSPVLGAAALGAVDDLALTRATGAAVGAELAACGVDLDLAPVGDVNSNPDNPVIGTRSFGTEPHDVARHLTAWVEGLQSTGVAACVKHFPGHGDTAADSHLALPLLDVPAETLAARELVPFEAAIGAGAAAVMTSHIVVPALDDRLPATLSPAVLGHLRAALGFQGVIVSDALDMAGASAERGIPEAAVLSLAAGADLLCLGPDKDESLVRAVQGAVVDAVRRGRLSVERLADAAARIAARPRGPGAAEPFDPDAQLAGARAALFVEGDLPDLTDALLVTVDTEPNIAVGVVPWGLPAGPASPSAADPGRTVVVQARDAHRHPATLALLADLAMRVPVVLVEWGWPGPVDVPLVRVVTHGSSRPARRAVEELLQARGWRR
ncbi:glycoside hydrolase family 3 N-terminal domain-containing protein [uncultured Nocardioides sp.]|uniref:glycoside hydrolase family 3 N-terminal domain-containing protein n=1 Tax=uncultured Nocardioides sp. TaxID=198441 RepID=UPI0025E6514B|nr:glycoside hydrolase family 3 N-terminal domain-containing protein [uncultured Nocardioides sp.]